MKLIQKDTYTTTILSFVDDYGNEYTVKHSDSFDDIFIKEWEITDEDGYQVSKNIENTLIELALNELNKQ